MDLISQPSNFEILASIYFRELDFDLLIFFNFLGLFLTSLFQIFHVDPSYYNVVKNMYSCRKGMSIKYHIFNFRNIRKCHTIFFEEKIQKCEISSFRKKKISYFMQFKSHFGEFNFFTPPPKIGIDTNPLWASSIKRVYPR